MASFDRIIRLTSREEELFELFRATIAFKGRITIARVAGGWVRDKLLGRESDDIDIALDDQTGIEFATSVQDYLISQGQTTRRIAVIEANPEQSKHLETATTHVLDHSVDFVNLRAETYASDTRIPEIRFGTPLEDALRRDFTINALFFNINTCTVEDLTCQGIDDLHNAVLRTPLDPLITFKDDPLRVLRAVRFAARFQLSIAEPVITAARHVEVLHGLQTKISRERIVREIDSMLSGGSSTQTRPMLALELLRDCGLYETVFSLPGEPELYVLASGTGGIGIGTDGGGFSSDISSITTMLANTTMKSICTARWVNALLSIARETAGTTGIGGMASLIMTIDTLYTRQEHMVLSSAMLGGAYSSSKSPSFDLPPVSSLNNDTLPLDILSPSAVRIAFWSAAVVGLQPFLLPDTKKKPNKTASSSAVSTSTIAGSSVAIMLLKQSLRTDGDTQRDVARIHDGSDMIIQLANNAAAGDERRLEVGLAVRACRELWPVALCLACAKELSALPGSIPESLINDSSPIHPTHTPSLTLSPQHLSIISKYIEFYRSVWHLGLEQCWLTKPLLDGQALQRLLGLKPGAKVGLMLEKQMRWQLQNAPSEGDMDRCVEYLKKVASMES